LFRFDISTLPWSSAWTGQEASYEEKLEKYSHVALLPFRGIRTTFSCHWIFALLVPLAVWILISGLDDLFVGLRWLGLRKSVRLPTPEERDAARERRIAIFVPLWREHAVTGQMLERTVSTLRYGAYDIFAGVYPNHELYSRSPRRRVTIPASRWRCCRIRGRLRRAIA